VSAKEAILWSDYDRKQMLNKLKADQEVCCNVLPFGVAVCRSCRRLLHCITVCQSVSQCVSVLHCAEFFHIVSRVLQSAAACCSVLHCCVVIYSGMSQCISLYCIVSHHVAVFGSVLQYNALLSDFEIPKV